MSRGRRTPRRQVSMNLFPFLAVLICTMGSLIVLLVVMVQQARVRAQTLSAHEPPASAVAPKDASPNLFEQQAEREERQRLAQEHQEQIEHFQWQASLLRQSYAQSIEQLAQRRLALSHLESHARELSETATKMQSEADAIARAAESQKFDQEETQQEIARLAHKIGAANTELAETRQKIAQYARTYALVPYEGPNGTHRRPIYIECLADRVVFQPEGVTLWGEDFREPLGVGNPLAAALRAKREFLLEHGLIGGDDEPYPLLVVRPHAAPSYAAARIAMKAWEAEFGYELVEENIKLEYRPADPRLTDVLEEVVADARERRRLARIARLRQQRRPQEGLLRASPRGGFEPVDGGTSGPTGSGRVRSGRHGYPGGDITDEGRDLPFGPGSGPHGSEHHWPGSAVGTEGRNATTESDADGGMRGDAGAGNEPGRADASRSDRLDPFGTGAGDVSGGQGSGSINRPGGPDDARAAFQGATPDRPGSMGRTGSGAAAIGSAAGGSREPGAATHASPVSSQFSDPQCLADTRGVDWALPDSSIDAVGIRRPIRVTCSTERLVLLPEPGTPQQVQVFNHHGSLQAVIDPFVNSVRERLGSWGIAGRGIYWKPVLQVEVDAGAGDNFAQLVRLLEDSGIQVTRKP